MKNNNICHVCDQKINDQSLSYDVADTGRCGLCDRKCDCWDRDLIEMYYTFGLSDDQIFSHLPRLRNSFMGNSKEYSLAKIAAKITALIQ